MSVRQTFLKFAGCLAVIEYACGWGTEGRSRTFYAPVSTRKAFCSAAHADILPSGLRCATIRDGLRKGAQMRHNARQEKTCEEIVQGEASEGWEARAPGALDRAAEISHQRVDASVS